MATDIAFKRERIGKGIDNVRLRYNELRARCDEGKKWMLALWLGTIAFVVKEGLPGVVALELIILELLMFFLLEVYYCYFAVKYGRIVADLDQWLMAAPDAEVEERAKAMDRLIPEARTKDRVNFLMTALMSHAGVAFYAFILTVSVFICLCAWDVSKWGVQPTTRGTATQVGSSAAPTTPSKVLPPAAGGKP